MPVVFILGAFAVVAVLMVIGMRQRWIPGTRGRWEPGAPGAVGIRSRRAPAPTCVLGVGRGRLGCPPSGDVLGGALLRDPLIGYAAALAAYVATWIARMILADWTYATSRILRIAAIVLPLAFVASIGLTAITRSIWWFIVGAVTFVGIPPAAHSIHRRRRDRET